MEVQAINGFKNLATSMHGHMMSRLRRGELIGEGVDWAVTEGLGAKGDGSV